MEWVIAAVAVLTLGLAALAAAGQLGSLPAADDDTYRPELGDGEVTASQLRSLRFGVAIRGYDMAQVDALLNRLADQLDEGRPAVEPAAGQVADQTRLPDQVEAAVDDVPDQAREPLPDQVDVEVVEEAAPAATSGLGMPEPEPNTHSAPAPRRDTE